MKKLKKLSLENEMKKEAEQIEKKVREDRSLDDITVSDEMEKELFNKIQDYEYDKRHKKVVRKKKKSKLVIGALAAVLILVCGSVMTSVGSKSYWKTLWNDRDDNDEEARWMESSIQCVSPVLLESDVVSVEQFVTCGKKHC